MIFVSSTERKILIWEKKNCFSNLEYDCIGNLYWELLYDDNIVFIALHHSWLTSLNLYKTLISIGK